MFCYRIDTPPHRNAGSTGSLGRSEISTSTKSPSTIRQGGPGAAHENAKTPLEIKKPPDDSHRRRHGSRSTGSGDADEHHAHEPERKGGRSKPAE
jgi:hypothetical protein